MSVHLTLVFFLSSTVIVILFAMGYLALSWRNVRYGQQWTRVRSMAAVEVVTPHDGYEVVDELLYMAVDHTGSPVLQRLPECDPLWRLQSSGASSVRRSVNSASDDESRSGAASPLPEGAAGGEAGRVEGIPLRVRMYDSVGYIPRHTLVVHHNDQKIRIRFPLFQRLPEVDCILATTEDRNEPAGIVRTWKEREEEEKPRSDALQRYGSSSYFSCHSPMAKDDMSDEQQDDECGGLSISGSHIF